MSRSDLCVFTARVHRRGSILRCRCVSIIRPSEADPENWKVTSIFGVGEIFLENDWGDFNGWNLFPILFRRARHRHAYFKMHWRASQGLLGQSSKRNQRPRWGYII